MEVPDSRGKEHEGVVEIYLLVAIKVRNAAKTLDTPDSVLGNDANT